MSTSQLVYSLANPTAYSHPVDAVEVRQTHISVVFLAGPFVYKIKKPVDLGFLDFTTLERRRHFCELEVRLNRRLAPHVYLGVVPVVEDQGRVRVDAPGEPVEWAVKMVRLPERASLLDRVLRGEAAEADMTRLGWFLAEFHATADAGPQVNDGGRFETVAGNARENFAQAEPHVGITLSRAVFDRLRERTEDSLADLRSLIETRAERGVPRDTHGDLHLDHVYFGEDEKPFAIDCIEFNDRFRFADPVADVAFLVMDLRFRRRPDLADTLADAYFEASRDYEGRRLLPFYTAYRAAIRAKVDGIEAGEPEVPENEREAALERSTAHWLLALGELEAPGRRPGLVLVGGLSGTGKSTLARRLAEADGFEIVRSDVVRKELAGFAETDPAGSDLYSAEQTTRTYEECRRRAGELLFDGRRVIVDATFRADARRREFLELARRLCVPAVLIVCETDAEEVQRRLAARFGDPSDATWEVYQQQQSEWEPASPGVAPHVVVVRTDTGTDPLGEAEHVLGQVSLRE